MPAPSISASASERLTVTETSPAWAAVRRPRAACANAAGSSRSVPSHAATARSESEGMGGKVVKRYRLYERALLG